MIFKIKILRCLSYEYTKIQTRRITKRKKYFQNIKRTNVLIIHTLHRNQNRLKNKKFFNKKSLTFV